jgi:hypothetical protein
MKTTTKLLGIAAAVTALGANLAARAGIINFSSSGGGHYTAGQGSPTPLGQVIPDNDLSGVAYALNFAATGLHITDISVSFTTAGGWNGDLYAYLSHGDSFAVLLNRVGTVNDGDDGHCTSGLNLLLQSVTTHPGIGDIHTIQNPASSLTAYAADGRVVCTDTVRPQTLDVFLNGDPNGSWTLFIADRAAANTSTLNNWSLDITAVDITPVPEPVNVALGCFAGVFVLVNLVCSPTARKLFRRALAFRL